ncbi:MAG: phosphatidylserine decarboxylase [Oscillospiraceae bacterium]|nr:phosphatidylserine decarboxylase [Oscillospiraceae bacterium]
MAVIDRNGNFLSSENKSRIFSQENILKFLYNTIEGRILLKVLTLPLFSEGVGMFMDSRFSKFLIKPFVKRNNISLSDYYTDDIKTYNDFFTRKIKPEMRKIDKESRSLISPCDAKLSVYNIDSNSTFEIKGSEYSIYDMIENKKLAKKYNNGLCLIFRLEVTDYHRYCYFDSGYKSSNMHIKGELHTVNPIAFRKYNVYKRNSREYTLLHTRNFGDAVQIEVGAMMVGKIKNHHGKCYFTRGQEKGMFLFGGSTIVVLLEKDKASIDDDIIKNTLNGFETAVKYGEKIGTSTKKYD